MTVARVIGLGQRAAGDDGVGLVVLDRLRELASLDLDLVEIAEPCALIPLLTSPVPVVIIDAVVTDLGVPGDVLELDSNSLSHHVRSVSTHGVGLARALALARLLAEPDHIAPAVRVVGVTITASTDPAAGLSTVVEAAVPRAVTSVVRLVREWIARQSAL